jgi:hypothetical protein
MMANISSMKPKQQLFKNALLKISSGVNLIVMKSNTFQGEHLSQPMTMESSLTIVIILGLAFKLYMAQYNKSQPNALTSISMDLVQNVGVEILYMLHKTNVTTVILM